jgi:hypothetical protein
VNNRNRAGRIFGGKRFGGGGFHEENSDPPHVSRLLRACNKRLSRDPAE